MSVTINFRKQPYLVSFQEPFEVVTLQDLLTSTSNMLHIPAPSLTMIYKGGKPHFPAEYYCCFKQQALHCLLYFCSITGFRRRWGWPLLHCILNISCLFLTNKSKKNCRCDERTSGPIGCLRNYS
jgi:hypothetical protein